MKTLGAVAVIALSLMGSASAQPYGGRDDGYRERGDGYQERGEGSRERGRVYRDRDDDDEERGQGRRRYGFDEREYLRCNPDVRQAVNRGIMESGAVHYQTFGRRENRRLSC